MIHDHNLYISSKSFMYIYLKFRCSSKIPPCKQLVSNKQLPHVVKALESYAMNWETTKIYSQRPIWPRVNFCGSFWKQPTVKLISHLFEKILF